MDHSDLLRRAGARRGELIAAGRVCQFMPGDRGSEAAADARRPEQARRRAAGEPGAEAEIELGVGVQEIGPAAVEDQRGAAGGLLGGLEAYIREWLDPVVGSVGEGNGGQPGRKEFPGVV